ncbi:MAG: PEGA domain-containing protein [Deltaproteobacteria bacterium]|nr:PEGA domain-containing protein [Deltaproteobacteria bacterium]
MPLRQRPALYPSLAWCALAGLLAGLPSRSSAASPERIATAAFAVSRDPSGQKPAAALGALLRGSIRAHPRLAWIDPARVLSGDPKTREEETLERAQTALADGRRAYDAMTLDDAIARLGQAVSLYQQAGPLIGDLGELKTALYYLGAALTLRGSAEEGVSTFLELLTIDPGYAPAESPPPVQKSFDQALRRLEKAPNGAVEVYSTPPYAAVFIDGDQRGVTPLTVERLTAGTHYVRLEKDGYVSHGAPMEVSPGQRVTSQTRLSSIRRGAELRDLLSRAGREVLEDGMGGQLRSLGRLVVAETLIVVSVSQSGKDVSMTGAVLDATAAIRLATERAVFGADSAEADREMGEFVKKLLDVATSGVAKSDTKPAGGGSGFGLSEGSGLGTKTDPSSTPVTDKPPPTTPVTGTKGPDDEGMKTGTIVGISMAGAGVACGITGVILGSLAFSVHADYINTPQASPDLPVVRRDGKQKALLADIFYGAGAALAIAGGIVVLISESHKPTPAELLGSPVGAAPTDGGAMMYWRSAW